MNKIKTAIVIACTVLGVGLAAVVPSLSVHAAVTNPVTTICAADPDDPACDNTPLMDYVGKIVKTLLFILGALSVFMIIYSGIRYTTSAGDSKAVESAKNTLMYAVVGIIVATLAYAIVSFVTGRLGL
jgi:hypothetical protein